MSHENRYLVMEVHIVSAQIFHTPFHFNRLAAPNLTRRRNQTLRIHRGAVAAMNLHSQLNQSVPKSPNRMFILGMGFVGEFFAGELKNQGWEVHGTCTSSGKKKKLEDKGFDAHIFNANEPELSTLNAMKCCTHLLVSVPTVSGIGDPMLQHVELLRSTLKDGDLKWLSYLSSTSVYGDYGGAWVDEDSITNPANESAKMRLVAEEGWLKLGHDLGLSTFVFRLGGIYGPGRSAVDRIIKHGPLSEGQKMRAAKKYTSRVHVEDICQALKASIAKPSFSNVYNIVDDNPAPREEVLAYAWDLADKKWPGLMKQNTSDEGNESILRKGSSRGEKRVSNARVKNQLGVSLRHPSYISGIQSIIDQTEDPFEQHAI